VPLEALQAQDEAALNDLLKSQIPGEIEASFAEAAASIASAMGRVTGAMPLLDPTLELYDNSGTPIAINDDWQTSQKDLIEETTLTPSDPRESAIFAPLRAGNYTAVVRGKNGATGIAVVEAYNVSPSSGE